MRSKLIADEPKTFVVVLDAGEEILSSLTNFAKAQRLKGSSFHAIGALSRVELGWFNWESKKYQTVVRFDEQVELLSLIGDIAIKDSEPQIHAHLVVGRADGTAHGGHLLNATVRPTCELISPRAPDTCKSRLIRSRGLHSFGFEDRGPFVG
jgi:uncharacterized protein